MHERTVHGSTAEAREFYAKHGFVIVYVRQSEDEESVLLQRLADVFAACWHGGFGALNNKSKGSGTALDGTARMARKCSAPGQNPSWT